VHRNDPARRVHRVKRLQQLARRDIDQIAVLRPDKRGGAKPGLPGIGERDGGKAQVAQESGQRIVITDQLGHCDGRDRSHPASLHPRIGLADAGAYPFQPPVGLMGGNVLRVDGDE